MQTFLPYDNFYESLSCLDSKRLGKQRVESFQIINILYAKSAGLEPAWRNHPAVLMWQYNIEALKHYYNTSLVLWRTRGYQNKILQAIPIVPFDVVMPSWFGDKSFHDSHKSKLLQKNFEFYSKYNWDVPLNLSYVWPVTKKGVA